jgi:hypothetical protein
MINPIGKIGERSSGPTGFLVPGWSGGFGRLGISAIILYHAVGTSFSESRILVSKKLNSSQKNSLVEKNGRPYVSGFSSPLISTPLRGKNKVDL